MSHADRRRSRAALAVAGLLLVLAACGKDDGTSPEPPPPPPASMLKVAGTDSQIVVVGTTLPINPSVKVLSADGRPVAGATVTFTVDGGGGSVTGATPVTDANGVATLGSWRVGTTSGENSLRVSLAALPTIGFKALGRAGPAAALLKMEHSDNNAAFVGRVLIPPPVVQVVDAHGNGVSGVAVSFAITSGGGTLRGSIPLTNAGGFTGALGWQLGGTPGTNTLRASLAGMPPVDFTATGVARCRAAPTTFDATVSGELSTTDCTEGLFYYDHYSLTLPQAAAFSFGATSTAFDTYLVLFDHAGLEIAINDDFEQASTNSRIKAILPPLQVEASVSSYWFDETGPYQFSARATSASIENCEQVWVVPGIVTSQSIKSTDCYDDYLGTFDLVLVVLRAGAPVTIGMQAADWTTNLAVYGPSGLQGESATGSFTFTPQADALYGIAAGSINGQTGNYTLSISAAAPSASVAATTLATPRGERTAPAMASALRRGHKTTVGPVQALRDMVRSHSAMRGRAAARAPAPARRATARP